jgi:hypothetical protein
MFCDELITRPEESYRLWCVVVCDLETSRMRRSWPALGRSATAKKQKLYRWFMQIKIIIVVVASDNFYFVALDVQVPVACLSPKSDRYLSWYCGPGNLVGIANSYRQDGPGIESQWRGRDFSHLSRPGLEPTQSPVQWVPALSRG